MYYYQHHIGDYRRDTGHLTLLEHGIYRQLLDLYYITEKPLDANAMRLICVRSAEEQEAYQRILQDFFFKQNGKWLHKRCEEEIKSFHGKSDKAKESANKRWNKNKELPNANALQTHCESDANAMLTINQEPITNNHKPKTKLTTTPDGVSQDVWDSFVEQRKKSKAVISETVINSIQKEANKAGWTLEMALAECAARGWRGFKADWVISDKEKQITPSKTMQGIMSLQVEIDRLKNEGKSNELLEN